MALPEPREGELLKFHLYRKGCVETILGDPEKSLWSSIKHLSALGIANDVLYRVHGVANKKDRTLIAKNLKIYIQQAYEFYEAAQLTKPNTAPLFYYYSFLNLGKALCEIKNPLFHTKRQSRKHGITWKPPLANMKTVHVSLTERGVWHKIWEAVVNDHCPAANPTKLLVKDLFALCPEISIEYEETFGEPSQSIDIEHEVLVSTNKDKIWLKVSIYREDLKKLRLSLPKFIKLINSVGHVYHQVKSRDDDVWTFEFEKPKDYVTSRGSLDILKPEIDQLNLFTALDKGAMTYSISIQSRLPFHFPQLMILYTLVFWLGSLVRYDPHSVIKLQESKYWMLIDGFMNESRIWLLELFEWEFYQCETILRSAR